MEYLPIHESANKPSSSDLLDSKQNSSDSLPESPPPSTILNDEEHNSGCGFFILSAISLAITLFFFFIAALGNLGDGAGRVNGLYIAFVLLGLIATIGFLILGITCLFGDKSK